MKPSHQILIKQLEKNDWYQSLKIPCQVDYPVVQTNFTDGCYPFLGIVSVLPTDAIPS